MAQILAQSTTLLQRYDQAAQRHPISTKVATCFVGFAAGDAVAQSISRPVRVQLTSEGLINGTARQQVEVDFLRVLRMALFGALIAAPQMHIFHGWMEKAVMPKNPTHPVAVLSKVALDQIINSPLGTVCFFAWTQALKGTPDQIGNTCRDKLWDTTRTGWCMWPAAQAANFLFVPLQYRIVFINVVAIAWTCILSKIGNESS